MNQLVLLLNVTSAVLLGLSFASPHISVEYWPFLSFLALVVPFLFIINVVFVVYWLVIRKKTVLLSITVLTIGFLIMPPFYKLTIFSSKEQRGDLVLMSYNVRTFNKWKHLKIPDVYERAKKLIDKESPDILCFQEIDLLRGLELKKEYPFQQMKYINNDDRVILGILSKYPILESKTLNFPNTSNDAAYADILYRADTIRVYNVHLQSFRIRPGTLKKEPSNKLYRRLVKSFLKQQEQANILKAHIAKSPYRTIVCGDFNNSQYSHVYTTVKGNMQDSFLKKGSGLGRTFNFWKFPLRIDFILADTTFKVSSHQNFDVRLSDHFPVMASFEFVDSDRVVQ